MKTLRSRGHRTLTDFLKDLRQKAGLSQEQLGSRLRKGQRYVSRIESGDQIPDYLEARDWGVACGLTPWAFHWRFEARMKRHAIGPAPRKSSR